MDIPAGEVRSERVNGQPNQGDSKYLDIKMIRSSTQPDFSMDESIDGAEEIAHSAQLNSADSILIKASMEGDRSAFAELIQRYQGAVLGTVRRSLGNTSDAEDAVQEVFIRALVALPRYDLKRPFAPWILRITSNYCIDQLRRKKTRKYRLFSDLSEDEENRILRNLAAKPEVQELSPKDSSQYLEIARSLLEQLKPRRKMAFVLREIEGRAYKEVSSILGVPEITVRVRVSRARSDLHQGFRKHLLELEKRSRK